MAIRIKLKTCESISKAITAGLPRRLSAIAPRQRSGTRPQFQYSIAKRDDERSDDRVHRSLDGRNYNLFGTLLKSRFGLVLERWGKWAPSVPIYRALGIHSQADLNRESKLFLKSVAESVALANRIGSTGRKKNPLFWSLRNAFVRGDSAGLDRELKYAFQSFVWQPRISSDVAARHKSITDFRYPSEWYPATRCMQRTVHLHVGPTNSGKTYHALKSLEAAESGIYAGPLRLLAHEIYTRFQAKGKRCALMTGDEQRIPEGVEDYFSSCTVEMTPLNKKVDVAVIDEIQMIADVERGWAWTQAFLGVQAKELHVCGEERAVDLIWALCARTGDKLIVHRYERLNPLRTLNESLRGDFSNLRKGDCVVAFSRVGLHRLKAGIEQVTGRRCAIVYGSLPPETRVAQAALFNDPDSDYDFLVASDAIGMGLNLEIKRIIFETATKYDGGGFRSLSAPEMKQIGGRAGRYRTASQDNKLANKASPSGLLEIGDDAAEAAKSTRLAQTGYVTSLEDEDLDAVKEAFRVDVAPLKTAGILPPSFVVEQFSSYFPPETPLSFVLARLSELATLSQHFHMCNIVEIQEVADIIQPYPMSIKDRCVFLTAPVSLRDFKQRDVLSEMASCVSDLNSGHLLDLQAMDLEVLEIDPTSPLATTSFYLMRLEALHKANTLYLWLSYRFAGVFTSQHLAFHIKSLVEGRINKYLEHLEFDEEARKKQRAYQRHVMAEHEQNKEKLLGMAERLGMATAEPHHEGVGQWNEDGHQEPLAIDESELKDANIGEKASHEIIIDGNKSQLKDEGARV